MRFLSFVSFMFCCGLAWAAPLERDLGSGLRYYRSANLPGDLPPAASAAKGACVLDLRYAEGGETAAAETNLWLKAHATPRVPVFVLANAKTSPAVLSALKNHHASDGIIVLGGETQEFSPDIALKISPDVEQRAYDALATRPDTDFLLKENVSKVRNDEARLSKEHLSDSAFALPPVVSDSPVTEKATAAPEPPPLIDLVLQRAVQLHRALLGLKKIQP